MSLHVIDLNFQGSISLTSHQSIQERDPPLHFQLIREMDAAGRIHAVQVVCEQVSLVLLHNLKWRKTAVTMTTVHS